MAKCDGLHFLAETLIAEKAEDANLLPPENVLAQRPAREGNVAEAAPPFFTEGEIETRNNPGGVR